MLSPVQIPVQPSSQDCLAWSSDGELAIAAGEEVYLLIPRHGNSEPWTHVRITVSSFNTQEWPWQEQADFKDMSIGEEQARATVTALAWSPPGLAKHGRSVLAVLTSNLLLSFWVSNSEPADADSWKRVAVVNKALSSDSRREQRIRSMAWAPTNPQHVDRKTAFSRRKWGICLMAIADDSNGLYILEILSPFAYQSFAWNVKVLRRDNIPIITSSSGRPSLLSLAMNATHFIDRIEFGTWDGDIPIVYRISGIARRARVAVHENPLSGVQPKDSSDLESLTVSLDEARSGHGNMPSQIVVTPSFKARMAKEKERFGQINNIDSHVILRNWGLASFTNLVAACVTLHPAKLAEYNAPFEGVSTILFDALDENGDSKSVFPWQSPAEVDVAKTQQYILETVLNQSLQTPLALSKLDLKIMYAAFCGTLLLRDQQRLQAAVDILNLIERHASTDLLAEHRALLSIKTSNQLSEQELIEAIIQMTKVRGQTESRSCTPEKAFLDLCPFCPEDQRIIPFESFTEAYCPQRHSFGKLFPLLPNSSPSYTPCSKVRSYVSAAT